MLRSKGSTQQRLTVRDLRKVARVDSQLGLPTLPTAASESMVGHQHARRYGAARWCDACANGLSGKGRTRPAAPPYGTEESDPLQHLARGTRGVVVLAPLDRDHA